MFSSLVKLIFYSLPTVIIFQRMKRIIVNADVAILSMIASAKQKSLAK